MLLPSMFFSKDIFYVCMLKEKKSFWSNCLMIQTGINALYYRLSGDTDWNKSPECITNCLIIQTV